MRWLLALPMAMTIVSTVAKDCNSYWRWSPPTSELLDCIDIEPVPEITPKTNVKYFRYGQGWDVDDPSNKAKISLAIRAISESLPVFSSFSTYDLSQVYVYLLKDQRPNSASTYAQAEAGNWPGQPSSLFATECRIMLFPLLWSSGQTEDRVKQIIAHELYHCALTAYDWEKMLVPVVDENPHPGQWWREGIAVYMSNHVYKTADAENEYLVYNPEQPIYKQTNANGYESFLFFHAMEEGGKSADDINTWITQQTIPLTYLDERRRLSTSVPGFADDFERFAQLFAVNGIHDSIGGRAFPTQTKITVSPITIPDLGEGQESSHLITIAPFTISVYEAKFPAGNIYGLSSETQARNMRISYRFDHGTTWKPFSSSMTQESDCATDKSIFFLVISTDDSDNVEANLKITKINNKACACKQPEAGGTSCGSCVTGNGSTGARTETTTDGGKDDCPRNCLLGNWVATPASMELHSLDQYLGYYPTGFPKETANHTTSYTVRITPNSAVSESGDSKTFAFEEVLIEEMTNIEQVIGSRTPLTLKVVSTSNVNGTLISVADSASTADFTFGNIARQHLSGDGSVRITTDGGMDVTQPTNGLDDGPRGSYFAFDCTSTTLNYIEMTRFHSNYRSYTFTRG